MNLSPQEAAFAGTLGAVIGVVYTVSRSTWGAATLEDVVLYEVLASGCIGAVAGILAFALRQRS
jgi:hypothetical protein